LAIAVAVVIAASGCGSSHTAAPPAATTGGHFLSFSDYTPAQRSAYLYAFHRCRSWDNSGQSDTTDNWIRELGPKRVAGDPIADAEFEGCTDEVTHTPLDGSGIQDSP
jgi:hypothetical protein